jgi:CRISP-associated protein Cas1
VCGDGGQMHRGIFRPGREVRSVKGALPATATELGRLSDRLSFLHVEHALIDRDANAVTIWQEDGVASVPAAMLAALLLGPGSRITHAAVALLARSGCSVLWTGEEGVRLYAGAVSASTTSGLLQRQARLVTNQRSRLAVARAMYEMRFPGEDLAKLTMQQLRGREGARVRRCYRVWSEKTGVPWHGRSYMIGKWRAADPVNQCLSAANSALYGVCHAGILHLGCSPGLGFVHTGHQLSFVYDLADLYKAEVTIPVAFEIAAVGGGDFGGRARRAVRDAIVASKLLPRIVADIKQLLGAPEGDDEVQVAPVVPELWDGGGQTVPGGVGYGDELS